MGLLAVCMVLSAVVRGQGPVLVLTPGATTGTIKAGAMRPSAVAYDSNGNLYVADAGAHVVRRVSPAGVSRVFAGTGEQGFSGDGGAATSAELDTPMGLAVDAAGNLLIADAHNNRVRHVSVVSGVISTVAGDGACRFAGDGGSAASASLCWPAAVAADRAGNLFVADLRNHRVRRIDAVSGLISTVAGNGDETYSGDDGMATAAGLDSPSGVAVDASGNLYVADSQNARVRVIDAGTDVISTVKGADPSGLRLPVGVTIDASGNVLIADRGRHQVRAVSGGVVSPVMGDGDEITSGDGGSPVAASLQIPRAVAVDANGGLAVSDVSLRSVTAGRIDFGTAMAGGSSATEIMTIANSGTAVMTVTRASTSSGFSMTTVGSCGKFPLSIDAGKNCTIMLAFMPVDVGLVNGSVSVAAAGLPTQSVLLAGTSVDGTTSTGLSASSNAIYEGQTVALAVTESSGASGTIAFYDGGTQIGSAVMKGSTTSYTTASLGIGGHSLTASYSGDSLHRASTSQVVNVAVAAVPDFSLVSGSSTGSSQNVSAGQATSFQFAVQGADPAFAGAVTFSVSGLPAGAAATFSPSMVNAGSGPTTVTLTVQTAKNAVAMLLPVAGVLLWRRRRVVAVAMLLLVCVGCGTGTKVISQSSTIVVTAQAKSVTGTILQHTISFALMVD